MELDKTIVPSASYSAKYRSWISHLSILSVADAHSGSYSCQAEESGLATHSPSVRISVIGKFILIRCWFSHITFATKPVNRSMCISSSIGLQCQDAPTALVDTRRHFSLAR